MFFNDLAINFLGEKVSIPIVVSNISNAEYNDLLNNGVYYKLSFISDIVKTFSSTIYAVKGNNYLDKAHQIELSLLKSLTGNTIDGQLIMAEVEHSKVYNKTKEQEAANVEVELGRFDAEVNKIKENQANMTNITS